MPQSRLQLLQRSIQSFQLSLFRRSVLAPLGMAAVLGTSGSLWLTEALIMPKAASAYTARLDLYVTHERGENYDSFLRRAEMAARAGAQRSFDQDLLITEVTINVVAESDSVSVPVLTLAVDRSQWQQHPETSYWATYYSSARVWLNRPPGDLTP